VALALIIRAVTHAVINRVTERAAEALLPQFRGTLPGARLVPGTLTRVRMVPVVLLRRQSRGGDPGPAAPGGSDGAASHGTASAETLQETAAAAERAIVAERRHQRVRALGSILRSAASVTIFSIAGAVILGDLGINLAPLLASAGVVGIAIGFGAQNLVRDYLTGIFMLLEDQYGVGDSIKVGDVSGTVETVTLRITRIRDVKGVVWHIRNGTIDQVGNQSQGWARAVVDFPVPYTGDLAAIRAILDGVAEACWDDPALRGALLEKPEVWGAQDVSSTEVTMRIVAKTAPLLQWRVERETRARVKAALDAAGIYPDPEPMGPSRRPKAPAVKHVRPSEG
jgi:hypothetical protein